MFTKFVFVWITLYTCHLNHGSIGLMKVIVMSAAIQLGAGVLEPFFVYMYIDVCFPASNTRWHVYCDVGRFSISRGRVDYSAGVLLTERSTQFFDRRSVTPFSDLNFELFCCFAQSN